MMGNNNSGIPNSPQELDKLYLDNRYSELKKRLEKLQEKHKKIKERRDKGDFNHG